MWAEVGTQKMHITSAHCGLRLAKGNGTANGTNVQLWEGDFSGNEWVIEPVPGSDDKKYITSAHCGLRLNTADGMKKNMGWTNVQLWEGAGPGNEWIIEPVPGSDDKKYITSAQISKIDAKILGGGLRLNTDGTIGEGAAVNGTNVKLWEREGPPPAGNEWIITGAGVVEPPKTKAKSCLLL